jgi:hypothetical protein
VCGDCANFVFDCLKINHSFTDKSDRLVLTVKLIFAIKSVFYDELNKVENLLVKFDSFI